MNSTPHFTISAIIPCLNSQHTLHECLEALCHAQPPFHEIIVVDDCSSDATAAIAQQFSVKLLRQAVHQGLNFCRNHGAQIASGEFFLFIDSDIVAPPDIVTRIQSAFASDHPDAIVGVYSANHRHRNLASQYKNLWIRYSYLKAGRHIDWIFGACAAIRCDAFRHTGGFDDTLFIEHGGDDLELGKRMSHLSLRIRLRHDIEVEHLKQHTLFTLLKNDFNRSSGFFVLASRLGQVSSASRKGFANVYPAFILSLPLAWLLCAACLYCFRQHSALVATGILLGVYLALNSPFLCYLSKNLGLLKIPGAIGILFLDHLTCTLGSITGWIRWLCTR